MAEAHPIELRQRLVEAHERGEGGYILLARRFSVGEATAKRWVWRFRREGTVVPRKKGGGTHSDVTQAELEALLTGDFDVFRYRFGIRPDGNAPEDPQGEFTGKNLLYVASTIEEVAERAGLSRDEVDASLQRSRMVLFQARLSRPRRMICERGSTSAQLTGAQRPDQSKQEGRNQRQLRIGS